MKKIIIFFLVFYSLFITHYSLAQSGWYNLNSGSSLNIYNVYFININTGWCSGDSGKIFKTTNSGNNWTTCNAIISSYYNVSLKFVRFSDSLTGFSGGGILNPYSLGNLYIFKTTNGGANWNEIYFGGLGTCHYSSAELVSPSTFYVSAFGYYWDSAGTSLGFVGKTTNAGANFSSFLPLPYTSFKSLSFVNSSTGWVTGYRYNYAGAICDYIFKTTDAGNTWNMQYKDSVSPRSINKIQFLNENTGYGISGINSASGSAKLLKTTNGGINWNVLAISYQKTFNSLFFVNESTGWICGPWSNTDSVLIAKTSDGGSTFSKQKKASSSGNINCIYFINSLTGFAVGNGGVILKTTTGGTTFVNNISNSTTSSFSLSQNYPNPFNPATIIKFKIKETKTTTLRVFDLLGREVQTLINEKLKPGEYEVTFDGSTLPSGVYFYKLTAGDFTEIKKMLLIK